MPAKPKPPVYGKPEPRDWKKPAVKWAVIVLGLVIIGWLVHIAKPMHKLVCDSDNVPLTDWGTCHDE